MDKFGWWTELTHGGLLISTPVLQEMFTEIKVSSDNWQYRRLRDHYNSFRSKEASHTSGTHPVHDWLTNLFEDFLGYDPIRWLKGADIPKTYSILSKMGQLLKPRRVLVDENNVPIILLQTDASPRLGMHKGRRSYAQFVELLRKANVPLGILSNGHQIRLVYAGLDHDAWTQWQVDAWFDEGEIRHQLDGFVTLLNPKALEVQEGTFQLHQAVTLSRSRQADLSEVLGGQIRQAVEILTSALGRTKLKDNTFLDPVQITPLSETILSEKDVLNAVYLAATRLVMRIVVLFFAEAKNLLPKDNPFYLDNYSLEGLYSNLRAASQHAGESELETRYSAWPRFLALSRLVHTGSAHEILPLNAYGGSLFKPGSIKHRDAVIRALSLFEDPVVQISDQEFYSILRLVKIGRTKVKQGRSFTWVSGPVDFNDLRTEYIGMMYEGLLDYELKIVEKESPKIILNIGNQPILPLRLLENLDDSAIKNLFEKMKENKGSSSVSEEEMSLEPEIEEDVEKESGVEESEDIPDGNPIRADENSSFDRALSWALKAIEAARLIRRPRGGGIALQQYEEKKLAKARSLLIKVLEPGEMYLVRWGGTRKGTGTFYTKPALAVPTTQRTLEPLVYDSKTEVLKVKPPQDILSLKICDPGVGSGTFLVAAARYLTETLYESLLIHVLTNKDENGQITKVPKNIFISSSITLEPPPISPSDESWEDQMKARLKRLVVEHCLYGVDLNGMAVELARVSLWLETMDKELPFEFLDHRIKQGNALLGTWFSQFLNYPAKAWERKDGTSSDKHNKTVLRESIKPELVRMISQPGQFNLYTQEEPPEMTLKRQLENWDELAKTQLFDTEKREQIFQDKIENDPSFLRLKHQFDRWCSVWFWPSEDKSKPILSPLNFFNEDDKINDIVNDLKSNYHFFHWELEFPEVFVKHDPNNKKTGFDTIIGNPAWDIQKPNSQEFFSNFDPIYRTYGKQEALRKQQQMFEGSSDIERQWLAYSAGFKAMSNYVRNSNAPYDISLARGRANDELRRGWESIRKSQKAEHSLETPYRIQGGADLNLYKLFLEQAFHLMRPEGRIGMIIPSGIYTDKGSTELRKYFLKSADWEWLFVFENKERIFDIHRSYKFGPIILTKGRKTKSIKCAFMRHDVRDWESPHAPHIKLPVEKIEMFSPNTMSFMEFKSDMDLKICEKIYGDRPLLGDQVEGGWNVKFAREFDMTNDSHLFTSRSKLETMGLLSPEDDTRDPRVRVRLWKVEYVPIWEGKHFWFYDQIDQPRLFSLKKYNSTLSNFPFGFRRISSNTNERCLVGCLPPHPNPTLYTIEVARNMNKRCALKCYGVMTSFIVDYTMRFQVSTSVALFNLYQIPVLLEHEIPQEFLLFMKKLLINVSPKAQLTLRCMIDAWIASLYCITEDEFLHILNTFPLVDRNIPIEQRQTTLTLEAFRHLKKVGLERFLEEGWELPDYVTEFDRPGIKIWEPEGGWEKAWAEAKAMLTEEEWKEFIGENEQAQNAQKPHAVHEKPEKYGQKKLEFD